MFLVNRHISWLVCWLNRHGIRILENSPWSNHAESPFHHTRRNGTGMMGIGLGDHPKMTASFTNFRVNTDNSVDTGYPLVNIQKTFEHGSNL